MNRFAQIVLTTDQLDLTAAALGDAAQDTDLDPETAQTLETLRRFCQAVSEDPSKFPVTGTMATTIRTLTRRAKGAAQPKPLNKRKKRQETRQGYNKSRRKFRAKIAASYNEARLVQEAENAEMEAIHAENEARWNAQPKFDVVATDGTVLMASVPEEFVRPSPVEELPNDGTAGPSEIVLP